MLHRTALCCPNSRLLWTVCTATQGEVVLLSVSTGAVLMQLPFAEIRTLSLDTKSKMLLRVVLHRSASFLLWCDTAELFADEIMARTSTGDPDTQQEADDSAMFSCIVSMSSGAQVLHSAVAIVNQNNLAIHTSDRLAKYPLSETIRISLSDHPCVLYVHLLTEKLTLEFSDTNEVKKCETLLLGYMLLTRLGVGSKDWREQFYLAPSIASAMLRPGRPFYNPE